MRKAKQFVLFLFVEVIAVGAQSTDKQVKEPNISQVQLVEFLESREKDISQIVGNDQVKRKAILKNYQTRLEGFLIFLTKLTSRNPEDSPEVSKAYLEAILESLEIEKKNMEALQKATMEALRIHYEATQTAVILHVFQDDLPLSTSEGPSTEEQEHKK